MAKTPKRTSRFRPRTRNASGARATGTARGRAEDGEAAHLLESGHEGAPISTREGARRRTVFADVEQYSVTLPAGALPGSSVLEHAQANPYLGLSVDGAGNLGTPGGEELERVYYVFGDAVAGHVETRLVNGRYEVFAGVPSAHFAAAHHIVQSERPLKVRLVVWEAGKEIEFVAADLYAPAQEVGQRED